MKTRKPWLDHKGSLLSNDKLMAISKKWSAQTWEDFLTSTVDTNLSENEALTYKYESLCEEQDTSIWGPCCSLPVSVQTEIHNAVKSLETRSQRIMRYHFWEGRSLREIAKKENLVPSRIHRIKSDSLNQIGDLLENSVNTSSYLIGGSENDDFPKNRDEEIREVYSIDLEGSYLK